MCKKIKEMMRQNQKDIDTLLGGPTRLIVAERRNSNIASLLFAKSSFSKCVVPVGQNQKCGGKGCKTCGIMNLEKTITLWKNVPDYETTVKLDYRCDCKTENAIYVYVCKMCEANKSFLCGTNCEQW